MNMSDDLSLKHLPDNLNIESDVCIAIADFCIGGYGNRKELCHQLVDSFLIFL